MAAFKSDIESFFDQAVSLELRIQEGGLRPTCRGEGARARLILPPDLMNFEVASFVDLAFLLLVLGHETAHYLHRHNEHEDQSKNDVRAIEVWADYFGTKIALVMVTLATAVGGLASTLPGSDHGGDRIDAFGHALVKLSESYFCVFDATYEPADVRVATCVAGIMSFMDRVYAVQAAEAGDLQASAEASDPERVLERSRMLNARLCTNSNLGPLLFSARLMDEVQASAIAEIHRDLQSGQPALFQGMKSLPAQWLSLDYHQSEEERSATADKKRRTAKLALEKMGIDTTLFDDDNASG